jgi:hypothetical protein
VGNDRYCYVQNLHFADDDVAQDLVLDARLVDGSLEDVLQQGVRGGVAEATLASAADGGTQGRHDDDVIGVLGADGAAEAGPTGGGLGLERGRAGAGGSELLDEGVDAVHFRGVSGSR